MNIEKLNIFYNNFDSIILLKISSIDLLNKTNLIFDEFKYNNLICTFSINDNVKCQIVSKNYLINVENISIPIMWHFNFKKIDIDIIEKFIFEVLKLQKSNNKYEFKYESYE